MTYTNKLLRIFRLARKGPRYLLRYGPLQTWQRIFAKFKNIPKKNKTIISALEPGSLVYILTTQHCLYIAKLLQESLKNIDISVEIIFKRPLRGYAKKLHIVISPNAFNSLPSHYIAYQMEQSTSHRWFTKSYFKKLRLAKSIFDYSLNNIEFLLSNGFNYKQLFYMPISLCPNFSKQEATKNKAFDVVFYGDDKNPRRQKYLSALKNKFSLKIINNLFGQELYDVLKSAKIVVNIHYYDDALLETTRIYECLSLGCVVVSEESIDQSQHEELNGLISFAPLNDVESFIGLVEYLIRTPAAYETKVTENHINLMSMLNRFQYFFYRYLLSEDIVSFKKFCDLIKNYKFLFSKRVCLSLPETPKRVKSFEQDNKFDFSLFYGLRHKVGWIGCGLSYKFIIKKAKEINLNYIIICEDDVDFQEGFKEKLSIIMNYLLERFDSWDIFTGLIADLPTEAQISKIDHYSGLDFVYLDKMVSGVFCIYHTSIFDKIISWNENNLDVEKNTIDRFLQADDRLRVITTQPFLVGHKEDAKSTLWGLSNAALYKKMILETNEKMTAHIKRIS